MNKAIFYDRDGVIVKMVYDLENDLIRTVKNSSEIDFVPGIFDLLKYTKTLGYKNIIVSNQPDIGIKKISEKNFNNIKEVLSQKLKKEGSTIVAEYYCFHHPFASIEKYKQVCDCRKPKPGLFFKAAQEHNIDLSKSWMIGDGVNDILAEKAAGCKTILLANLEESEYLRILEEKLHGIKPDYIVRRLQDIIKIIK